MATQTLSKDDILEAIGNMSVFELAELIEAFKEKFGVTIAAPAAAPAGGGGAPGSAGAAAPAAEEKTEFTVVLKAGGEKKIQVIKEIRAISCPSIKRHKKLQGDWSSDVCSSDLMKRHTRLQGDWSSDVCSSD